MNKAHSAKVEKRQEKQRQSTAFSGATSAKGLSIEPQVAIIISLLYVGVVIILHMIGKYRKDYSVVTA